MYGLTSTCAILALLGVLRKKWTIWPFFDQKPWFSRFKNVNWSKNFFFLLNFDIKNNNRGVKWLNEAKYPSRTLKNSIAWVFGFKVVMARFYPCWRTVPCFLPWKSQIQVILELFLLILLPPETRFQPFFDHSPTFCVLNSIWTTVFAVAASFTRTRR